MNRHGPALRALIGALALLIWLALPGYAQGPTAEMVEMIPAAGPPAPPAPPRPADRLVMLRAGTIDPAALTPAISDARTQQALRLQGLTTSDRSYYVVKFASDLPSEAARNEITAAGGQIMGYVPAQAYVVRGIGRALLALRGQAGCEIVTAYHPADRIEPRLGRRLREGEPPDGNPINVRVSVLAFPGEDTTRIDATLDAMGATVEAFAGDRGLGAAYRVRCRLPMIQWIAAIPGVQWVEEWLFPRLYNDFATGSGGSGVDIMNVSDLASTYSLDGSGMIVGHADSGCDIGVTSTSLHRDLLDAAGTASRVTVGRGWGLRTDDDLWEDTYYSYGTASSNYKYWLEDWDAARDGVVGAVVVYLSKADTTPTGDIRLRLYLDAALPAGPDAMPGTPTATSPTVLRAEDIGTGGYIGYTFLFDPATTPVTNGEKWWFVIDLSEVTNYDKVEVILDVFGNSFLCGTSGSSWQTNYDGNVMSMVYDALRWDDLDGHGTHTLGSILGNGQQYLSGGSPRYRGAAFEASAVHQSVQDSDGNLGGIPYSLLPLFEEAYDLGARIHSNSWGSNARGNYTLDAMHVDQFMWENPDCLLLFSAGNDGMDGRWIESAPLNTEQQLNTTYYNQCFKLGSASGWVKAIVLNLRRSADADGVLYLWARRDGGAGPTDARYAQYGPVYVSQLPYIDGTSADFRPMEFNGLSEWAGGYTYWVEVQWSSRTQGDIYVGCDSTGTSNYGYKTGSGWVFVDQRQAVQLVTGDGKVDTGSIGSPATAKNCLAVGASETDRIPNDGNYDLTYQTYYYSDPIGSDSYLDNAGGMAATSSRGPTGDGRYKPDLVAPGTFIASCRSQKIPPLVSYDVEPTPSAAWITDGVWSRTNAYGAHSGSYAYHAAATGSAGSSYVTYNQDIDLSSQYPATWSYSRPFYVYFWANYTTSGTGDRVYLWGSADGGATWGGVWTSIVAPDSGGWAWQVVPISPTYAQEPDFRFRFELRDNGDGVYATCLLDDISIWLMTGGSSVRLNDLCAAGWDDYTANPVLFYQFLTGTSMACPLTAGVATLVREYYVEKKGLTDPSAALIKATMINEAVDMSPGQYVSPQELSARCDNAQGWGRVNAKGCLYRTAPRAGGYLNGVGAAAFDTVGQRRIILLGVPDVPANTNEPIKVTLAWTDRPGALWASPCLVNNLDLKVEHLTGYPDPPGAADATWYGNGAGSGGDVVNNVEGVDLAAPVTYGWYRVTVTCAALPLGGSQPWALVASGGFTNEWPTPVEVDGLCASTSAGGGILLHWIPAAGLDIAEFRVSRADSTAGPFEVVGRTDPRGGGRQCQFEDESVAPGRACVYRVEAIDAGGRVIGGDTVSAGATARRDGGGRQ